MSAQIMLVFFLTGIFLVGIAIIVAYAISPKSWNESKFEAYECGIPTKGVTWVQFNVGYYLFAIIYLVFDVELVFVYPWGAVMKEVGPKAFVEILIFFFVLGLGLLYAWKKKALKWQ
jgi:NADH-quinone oxidoreductase subunit A